MADIGFIGLGRMGRPMAGNMQQKGYSLLDALCESAGLEKPRL